VDRERLAALDHCGIDTGISNCHSEGYNRIVKGDSIVGSRMVIPTERARNAM
jgi:hypothetical protein